MYFYLKEPKSEKATLIYLIYQVPGDRRPFKKSTGEKIMPVDWDFERNIPLKKRGRSDLMAISRQLQNRVDWLEGLIHGAKLENKMLRTDYLIESYSQAFVVKSNVPNIKGVLECVQEFIDSKNRSGGQSKSWNQKYSNLKLKLEYFIEDEGRFELDQIDEEWIDRYCGYLRKIKRKPFKPHNDNTLHRNINFLFTFLNWSNGKYHNLNMDKIHNPVKKYQPEDVHLTASEVERLEKLIPKRKSHERVRDLFLIGIYSGQRFSDYSVFEKSDVVGDMIIKKAEKTEYESYIPLHDKLRALLKKYDWKLPEISEQKFNERVKKICEAAGIDEEVKETIYRGNVKEVLYHKKFEMIGSHTARRTFITLSSERGMPDHIIMKITGIRDPKTLLKYKKTSMRSVEESMKRIWG